MKKIIILFLALHISALCFSQNLLVWPESQGSAYGQNIFKIAQPDTLHRFVFSKTTRQDNPSDISYASEFFKDGQNYDVVFYPCEYIIYMKNVQITTQDETGLLYEAIQNIWNIQIKNSRYKN